MLISICIPVYEMNGFGIKYLSKLISSIETQTYKNYEIIISDHSKNDEIQKYCENIKKLKYFKMSTHYGNSSANVNNAIKNSNGDIIKIMFQDDFFCSTNCLEMISKTNKEWGALSFNHIQNDNNTIFRNMVPKYNKDILYGNNTIGCPSVIFMKQKILFDENLIWLMDCELYFKLFKLFGEPLIINEICVTIRVGDHTITNKITPDIILKETKYLQGKYHA